MTQITVDPMQVPTSLDAPDAADFIAAFAVRNAVDRAGYGSADFDYSPEEALPGWQPNEHEPMLGFLGRLDRRIVARGVWETRLGEAADAAWLDVRVLPDARRHGVGTAIAEHLEQLARVRGASKALVYSVSPLGPGDRLHPPTGAGSVPRDNAEVRFLLGRGYRLEQVERGSAVPLPLDRADVERRRAETAAVAGDDYDVVSYVGPTPPEWQEGIAHLLTRMSTDAPTAGLEEPEDPWSIERLAEAEARTTASGRVAVTSAVRHLPTGNLVSFTNFSAPADRTRAVWQEDTIVLREHRGHRLGMLVKLANLLHLDDVRPGHPRVITFNAEENRPMLSVNEAIGFEPICYEGAWRKDL